MQLGIAKQTLSNLETAKGAVGVDTALRAAREFGVAIFAVPAAEREQVLRAIREVRANMAQNTSQACPTPARGPLKARRK